MTDVAAPLRLVQFDLYDRGPAELELKPPEAYELHVFGAYANGRLPASALASITGGGRLRADAARAWNALQAESKRKYGRYIRVADSYRPLGAPGDSARGVWSQWAAWERYKNGGNLAAYPGTSNHGLGLAIDINTADRGILDAIGAKYGFAKAWSDAPSEPWHIKWRTGHYDAVEAHHDRPTLRPGARNKAVKQVKKYLRDADVKKASGKHRFPAIADNQTYGPEAVQRVRWFQEHHFGSKKAADGIVGPKTWEALQKVAKRS